jgi:anaerobic selenocysteine-containing dehydrogenase
MRKYGVFKVKDNVYRVHEQPLTAEQQKDTSIDPSHERVLRAGVPVGVVVGGVPRIGFNTPSRRLEFYSPTLKDWGWPEHTVPRYVPGHVHWRDLKREDNEFDLLPNFRLPTLIHTRSPVKWLYEISHSNPLWISTPDAVKPGIATGDLVKVRTAIGYFVTRAWVTEGIRPGIVGMSHHLGRWRLHEDMGLRNASALITIDRPADGQYRVRQVHGATPFDSNDPDSGRVWWTEVGVHQNLTFPVQPDPVSGMHCWHQKVRVEKAGPEDGYGDIFVDTNKSHEIYKHWMAMTRPAPGPGGLRRPMWFDLPLRPIADAYKLVP